MSSGRPVEKRERQEDAEVLEAKYARLVDVVAGAERICFLTGAGVSTSAGVPDFDGDNGLRKSGVLGVQEYKLDFAMPTVAHRAIAALVADPGTACSFVVTTNHDNAHAKAGTPADAMAELFGNAYVEDCLRCGARYTRSVIVPPMRRVCDDAGCGGRLKRLGIRYGETIPEEPFARACAALAAADLVVCLGSSLNTYPFHHLNLGPKMVIVNLQPTQFDHEAVLTFADFTDAFMTRALAACWPHVAIPPYVYSQAALVSVAARASAPEPVVTVTGFAPNEPFTAAAALYVSAPDSAPDRWIEASRSTFTGAFSAALPLADSDTAVAVRIEPHAEYAGALPEVWTVPLAPAADATNARCDFVYAVPE